MEKPFCADIPDGTKLIETFGCWPGEGPRRWPLHRARLAASAARMGFACPLDRIDAIVAGIAAGEQPLRCRLTLDAQGVPDLTCAPFEPARDVWTVTLSAHRIRADDPWLGVKSTQRSLYDTVRQQIAAPSHEVIFANEHGEICEGTISNLFVIDASGRKLTPALSCGILPGVLRQELLAEDFEEAILTIEDLNAARAVMIGNSLRGLLGAVWHPGLPA